jgi:hypothetical protein
MSGLLFACGMSIHGSQRIVAYTRKGCLAYDLRAETLRFLPDPGREGRCSENTEISIIWRGKDA